MTALDKAIIKAYRKPAMQNDGGAEPVVASTRISRPAVPLSKALAELSHLPSAVAPVGPAIAELLASAAHVTVEAAEEAGALAQAIIDPSSNTNASPKVAATANAVRAALPVVLAATVPGAAPIVAGSLAVAQAAAPVVRAVQAAATHASATPSEKQAVATNAIQSTAEVFESPGLGSMLKKKRAAPVETLAPPQSIAAKIMTATPPDIKDGEADRLPDIEVPAVAPIQVPMDAGLAPDASVSDVSPLAMTIADSMLPKWHPMLQVDRIVWPSACSRLQGMAAEALDQMVDGLRKIQTAGKKVIGMASCGDGEGVSTLLLAAARRMSSQGLNVAVVDANLARPTLASAIGLLPQLGWENALSGDTPLEDVVIESEADHLAILPTIHAPAELSAEAVESHLATLSQCFDSVLVDLGSLYAADGEWNEAASEIGARTGGMILVQNVRKTTPNRLSDAQSHLEQSGASLVGMVQNFVVA